MAQHYDLPASLRLDVENQGKQMLYWVAERGRIDTNISVKSTSCSAHLHDSHGSNGGGGFSSNCT